MKKSMTKWVAGALLAGAALLAVTTQASASPAFPGQQTLVQPTGQTFEGTLQGDEWSNWVTTAKGDVLLRDQDGFYKYAMVGHGRVQPSSARYGIDSKPSLAMNADDLKLAQQQ